MWLACSLDLGDLQVELGCAVVVLSHVFQLWGNYVAIYINMMVYGFGDFKLGEKFMGQPLNMIVKVSISALQLIIIHIILLIL